MGYDLVNWAPVVNTYDVPGSTTLAGTKDTGNARPVAAGDASGFSAIPTIAQLNASSDFNQVVGAFNRRALMYNALYGASFTAQAYVVKGGRPKASDFTTLLSNINSLRTLEGFNGGALVWPFTTPSAGKKIFGHHLAFSRQALRVSGTMNLPLNGGFINHYVRSDTPSYNTPFSEIFPVSALGIGKVNLTTQMQRSRVLVTFLVHSFISDFVTAQLNFTLANVTSTLESWNVQLYMSNTDDRTPLLTPAYGGSAYNLNMTEGSAAPVNGSNALGIVKADMLTKAGGAMSLVFGEDKELLGTGAGISGTNNAYADVNSIDSLAIDFGA